MSGSNITVRGVSPFEKPLIYAGDTNGMQLNTAPMVTDIRVRHSGGVLAIYGIGGTFTRVELVSSSGYTTCSATNNYYSSVCVNTVDGGSAIGSYVGAGGTTSLNTYSFHNVTAIASGASGYGFEASHTGGYRAQFNVYNSIVRGGTGSFRASTDGVNSSTVEYRVRNANFTGNSIIGPGSSFAELPGSVSTSEAPQFVDAATYDFRPLPTSVVVNAGQNADVAGGNSDFAGQARIQGSAVDVGAYELTQSTTPPTPTPAASVTKFKLSPAVFASAKRGTAFQPANRKPRKKRGRPSVGSTLSFNLDKSATIRMNLERRTAGRRSGGKCVKKTRANRRAKACKFWAAVRGTTSRAGLVGPNAMYFNGRWNSKTLKPGGYRLIATPEGGSSASALFKVIR